MPPVKVARIDSESSTVVNIELVEREWIAAHADPDGPVLFVEYDDTNPAHIGSAWDPIGGFDRPTPEPDTYKLTATELEGLGVDLVAVDALVADKLATDVTLEGKATR